MRCSMMLEDAGMFSEICRDSKSYPPSFPEVIVRSKPLTVGEIGNNRNRESLFHEPCQRMERQPDLKLMIVIVGFVRQGTVIKPLISSVMILEFMRVPVHTVEDKGLGKANLWRNFCLYDVTQFPPNRIISIRTDGVMNIADVQ